ncbi:hypothetical protein [Streptomyces thioluteus]
MDALAQARRAEGLAATRWRGACGRATAP